MCSLKTCRCPLRKGATGIEGGMLTTVGVPSRGYGRKGATYHQHVSDGTYGGCVAICSKTTEG